MKKVLIAMIFIISLTLPFISAVDFDMKSNFSQQEILMAKISGDFSEPVLPENIQFFRKHVRIAVDSQVAKINEDYYIYAPLTGKAPGNYSILIEEVEYRQAGKTVDDDLQKNFTITEDLADFTINPGFVNTKENFKIDLENIQSEEITLTMNISTLSGAKGGITNYLEDEAYEIDFSPGREELNFEIDVEAGTEKLITLSTENLTYEIPVSIFIEDNALEGDIFTMSVESDLVFTMETNSNRTKLLYIYNTGDGTLKDIQITKTQSLAAPFVQLSEDSFGQIIPGENANLEVLIFSGGERTIKGEIKITTSQGLAETINLEVTVEEGYEPTSEETAVPLETTDTCEQTGGKVCNKVEGETCAGEEFFASNNLCCVGTCKKEVKSSLGKIIGWLLVLVIIVVGVIVYLKKYKGVGKKKINLLDVAKGKKK